MSYVKFRQEKQVVLTSLPGGPQGPCCLQSTLRFSPGTAKLAEQLHHETHYEVLLPFDARLEIRICSAKASEGTSEYGTFQNVTVEPGEGILILAQHCHRVVSAGSFLVLKPSGSFKISKSAKTLEGECPFQSRCKTVDLCPNEKTSC